MFVTHDEDKSNGGCLEKTETEIERWEFQRSRNARGFQGSRNARDCQQPEARTGFFPSKTLEGSWWNLDFRVIPSRMWRKQISVVFSHSVCSHLSWQPWIIPVILAKLGFPDGSAIIRLPMQETRVRSLGGIDPMEKEIIFLKRSLVFPILLFSSMSLYWSLRKVFLSFLAIIWNSAFRCLYLSFSPLPVASLLFSAICKASSDSYFAFLHFFFLDGLDQCLLYNVMNLRP